MKHILIIYAADGRTFEVPAEHKGREFVAYQPARDEELNITKIRLKREAPDRSVQFILGSLTLLEAQAGRWTVTLDENGLGGNLEYYATEQFGRAVVDPLVLKWSHEQEGLIGD